MLKLDRETLIRYIPLLLHLEESTGYETVMVKMHGKRPVKLWRISAPQVLEMLDEDDNNKVIDLL